MVLGRDVLFKFLGRVIVYLQIFQIYFDFSPFLFLEPQTMKTSQPNFAATMVHLPCASVHHYMMSYPEKQTRPSLTQPYNVHVQHQL